MSCDARIRPFPDDRELACELDGDHERHRTTLRDMAYPGSSTTVDWDETDRRTFHGDWPGACWSTGCRLPRRHRGDHAL